MGSDGCSVNGSVAYIALTDQNRVRGVLDCTRCAKCEDLVQIETKESLILQLMSVD
jgi:hypothetical protein